MEIPGQHQHKQGTLERGFHKIQDKLRGFESPFPDDKQKTVTEGQKALAVVLGTVGLLTSAYLLYLLGNDPIQQQELLKLLNQQGIGVKAGGPLNSVDGPGINSGSVPLETATPKSTATLAATTTPLPSQIPPVETRTASPPTQTENAVTSTPEPAKTKTPVPTATYDVLTNTISFTPTVTKQPEQTNTATVQATTTPDRVSTNTVITTLEAPQVNTDTLKQLSDITGFSNDEILRQLTPQEDGFLPNITFTLTSAISNIEVRKNLTDTNAFDELQTQSGQTLTLEQLKAKGIPEKLAQKLVAKRVTSVSPNIQYLPDGRGLLNNSLNFLSILLGHIANEPGALYIPSPKGEESFVILGKFLGMTNFNRKSKLVILGDNKGHLSVTEYVNEGSINDTSVRALLPEGKTIKYTYKPDIDYDITQIGVGDNSYIQPGDYLYIVRNSNLVGLGLKYPDILNHSKGYYYYASQMFVIADDPNSLPKPDPRILQQV